MLAARHTFSLMLRPCQCLPMTALIIVTFAAYLVYMHQFYYVFLAPFSERLNEALKTGARRLTSYCGHRQYHSRTGNSQIDYSQGPSSQAATTTTKRQLGYTHLTLKTFT